MGGLATHGEVLAAIRLAQHHPDLGHQRRARRAGNTRGRLNVSHRSTNVVPAHRLLA